MKSKQLNALLIDKFPELHDLFELETSWQDGNDTGSHIVFEDVFVPYVKEQLIRKNEENVKRIAEFFECVLRMNDEYGSNVIMFSVVEPLLYDRKISLIFKNVMASYSLTSNIISQFVNH